MGRVASIWAVLVLVSSLLSGCGCLAAEGGTVTKNPRAENTTLIGRRVTTAMNKIESTAHLNPESQRCESGTLKKVV